MKRISPAFRLALAAKALLLLVIAGGFGFLAWTAWTKWYWTLLPRLSGAVLLGITAVAVAGAAVRGVADALLGDAVETRGARPLKSRRSGYSLRLPDGKFVEYVLYNPWPSLEAERTYTVVYGKFSRVLVARPEPE
ncbi:MAG: hypothetical protein U0228_26735 [Myxococcaceae bacterium]